ncbi:MAG: M28 family peptidase, partial [Flavobacteriales bacterium]|nr:M28 family peptidase [Flavobacteriales bacterium]
MRKLLVLLISLHTGMANAQDPIVQAILDDVSIDSLIHYASAISGEFAVNINGNSEIISSRNKNHAGNALAADYIQQKFESFGLNTSVQGFGAAGENILAIQTGQVYPNQTVVLCGHYDSMPTGNTSPAADDDGSGTAALIEAVRIMSQYNFAYTLVYAAWDEEEYGLVGSNYYATQAENNQ